MTSRASTTWTSTKHRFINLLGREDSNAGRVCASDCRGRTTDLFLLWRKLLLNSLDEEFLQRHTRKSSTVLGANKKLIRKFNRRAHMP
jgi:hypothetical protein